MANKASACPEGWQEKFFEYFAESGDVKNSAEAAGVSRGAVYYHKYNDEAFAERFERCRKEAHEREGHAAFRAAVKRAIEGWEEPVYQSGELVGFKTKYSDRLLELLLKKLDAQVFGDEPNNDQDRNIRIEFVPMAQNEEPSESDESANADDSE